MYEQNTTDFIRRLFYDSGANPTQAEVDAVVQKIPADLVTAADKLFHNMHPSQYVSFAEGEDTIDPEIYPILDALWDVYVENCWAYDH